MCSAGAPARELQPAYPRSASGVPFSQPNVELDKDSNYVE
jgi:hypothetical protein